MDRSAPILLVVHPGSACGSADFNLGTGPARAARSNLTDELNDWAGGVVVLDGLLSDELASTPVLDAALANSLARAQVSGQLARRVWADDPAHLACVRRLVRELRCGGTANPRFVVTGAWYHEDDRQGCVGSVLDLLTGQLGCEAELGDGALVLPGDCGDCEDGDCEDDVEGEPVGPHSAARQRPARC